MWHIYTLEYYKAIGIREKLAKEKEMIGIYVSGHPLDDYRELLDRVVTASSADFNAEDDEEGVRVHDKVPYTIGGMIETVTIKSTRRGDQMAFLTIEDLYGTLEVVVFPRDFAKYKDYFQKDAKVIIKGNASVTEEECKLLLSDIKTFEEAKDEIEGAGKELWIRFYRKEEYVVAEERLLTILQQNRGATRVNIVVLPQAKPGEERPAPMVKVLDARFCVHAKGTLIEQLQQLFGTENVTIREK